MARVIKLIKLIIITSTILITPTIQANLISNQDEKGEDQGNLEISTNTLKYQDIKDKEKSKTTGYSAGARSSLLRDIVAGLADTKPGEPKGNEKAIFQSKDPSKQSSSVADTTDTKNITDTRKITVTGRTNYVEDYQKNMYEIGDEVPQGVGGLLHEGSRTMKAAEGFLGTEYAKWHDNFVSGDPEAWAIGSNFVMVPIYFKYAWYTNTRASNLMKNIEEAKRVNNQESSKQPTHNSTITTGELYKQYQQIIYGSSYNEYQINDKLSINNQINNDTHTTYN